MKVVMYGTYARIQLGTLVRGNRGFTMVELLLVIITVGIIMTAALPTYLDFKNEARVASATQAANALKSGLAIKKQQMMLRCGLLGITDVTLAAINANDVTVGGQCTTAQLTPEERKILDANDGLSLPDYLGNGDTAVVACLCAEGANPSCFPAGKSYCHWLGDIRLDPQAELILARMVTVDNSDGPDDGVTTTTGGTDTGTTVTGGTDTGGCVPDGTYELDGDDLCRNSCDELTDYENCEDNTFSGTCENANTVCADHGGHEGTATATCCGSYRLVNCLNASENLIGQVASSGPDPVACPTSSSSTCSSSSTSIAGTPFSGSCGNAYTVCASNSGIPGTYVGSTCCGLRRLMNCMNSNNSVIIGQMTSQGNDPAFCSSSSASGGSSSGGSSS